MVYAKILIQKAQLKAKTDDEILEWIEYDRFENVEYLAKGGFGTIYKAIWKDGYIEEWDFENNKWERRKYYAEDYENFPVVLKCLHNSQDVTVDFLRETELHTTISSNNVTLCFDLPEPKNAVDDKDDDNSFEYSESVEAIDFTKLNLDKNS
ncbi:unnamed protein product [Rhizophagus irregularis]|nr:unnamed protein product [Rhizophagus irregularis]